MDDIPRYLELAFPGDARIRAGQGPAEYPAGLRELAVVV